MEYGEYENVKSPIKGAFAKAWWVDASWAHPFWTSYVLMVYDLKPHGGENEQVPVLYMKGATHEFMLFAIDPEDDTYRVNFPPKYLTPANQAHQFYAASDDVATQRMESLLLMIKNKQLNPDTDARSQWNQLFADGVTLINREDSTTRH